MDFPEKEKEQYLCSAIFSEMTIQVRKSQGSRNLIRYVKTGMHSVATLHNKQWNKVLSTKHALRTTFKISSILYA